MVDSGSGGMGGGMSPSGVTDVPPLSCEAPITVLSLRGGRSRLLVWVAASLLVALMAAVGLSATQGKDGRLIMLEQILPFENLHTKWQRDNHLALNSALAAVKSAARAQQLVQLPERLPEPAQGPAVHSWEPIVSQQQSQFQKWLKQERSRIQAYNGPLQDQARTRGQEDQQAFGADRFDRRYQSLKPMNLQLPKSVSKGISVAVQEAQAQLARKHEEVVPPGFKLACWQETHSVGPCESLPYKPLKKWYTDYQRKGKYAADLLWDRDRRLRSESENEKTWEQIKRNAASEHHSSTRWYRWRKGKRSPGWDKYSSIHLHKHRQAGKAGAAGAPLSDNGESFSWPDDADEKSGDYSGAKRDSAEGGARATRASDSQGGGDGSSDAENRRGSWGSRGGRRGTSSKADYGSSSGGRGSRDGGTSAGARSGGRGSSDGAGGSGGWSRGGGDGGSSARHADTVVVKAPAPVIDKSLASSIKGLADMVQELGGMLANWSPNVTVRTVPVQVSMPEPKDWGSVWKAAKDVLEKDASAQHAAPGRIAAPLSAYAPRSSPSTVSAPAAASASAPPGEIRVLDPPVLQPGGGIFDGGVTVNISSSNAHDQAADGNSSAVTVVHYMVSEPVAAPSYKTYPTVRSAIFQLDDGSAAALAGANSSATASATAVATAEQIHQAGQEYAAPLMLGPGRVVISAYASRDGWERSPVVSETYDVLECGDDKCCQWSVVYMRVKALLQKLQESNSTLTWNLEEAKTHLQKLHSAWLTSNSRYQAALIKIKDEQSDTQYAVGKEEMWREAVKGAEEQVASINKVVSKHLADLQEERALIQWIISQLGTAQLSAKAALGRVEQSLTDIQGSDTMGDLEKILVSAQVETRGRGRIHLPEKKEVGEKLAGSAGERAHDEQLGEEPQEIVRILEEMMEDLRKREDMFASMLAKAQSQLSENGAKYDEWQGKLSKVASEIDESRRIISQEEQRRQLLAGQLLVAQQAVDASAQSFPVQSDMLAASIASYQRVIASLVNKARGACEAVAQEESNVIEESMQVQSLMSKIRAMPESLILMTPRLRAQMAALQQLVNQESSTSSASSGTMLKAGPAAKDAKLDEPRTVSARQRRGDGTSLAWPNKAGSRGSLQL